jgi:hypothetical protein
MLHFLHHLLHPLAVLWRERNNLFWPVWIATTALAALVAVIWVVPEKKSIPRDSLPLLRHDWSRGAIVAVTFLAVLLACYIAGSLVWEDFTYYDNSHFTNGTLVGKDISRQILPANGRFFPLGHQEYNLIRHFTTSVTGYHALRIVQLLLLCGILLVFDEDLSIPARVGLIILILITPSVLISFSGLIYPEMNVIFWLICLGWFVKRFEQTQYGAWAVAAVISSQVMLYYKETAFLLLLGFAVGRLVLRCWNADHLSWDFKRLRDSESRLDMCLAFLAVLFFVYYLAAMYPNYNFGYADESQLPLKQILVSYVKLDLLVWVLAAVVLGRIVQILRRKATPELLWDGLALGGVGCLAGYLILRMNAGYFLAPADIIAVLYLGHFTVLSAKSMSRGQKLCVVSLLILVVLQDFSLSAFRMYERKNVIHAKAEMAQAIKRRYESDPQSLKRLFFPFSQPFYIMEFASYLNYIGVPVEQMPGSSQADGGIVVLGKVFQTVGPCGYRAFVCHPGNRPDPGDLVVVLPDDFTTVDELNSYRQEGTDQFFSYHPSPSIPRRLFPYVNSLHVVSPIFSQSQLPESWLNASVTVWKTSSQ